MHIQIQDLDILYHDDHIIAVSKPSGILVHPAGKPGQDNIVDYLRKTFNDPEIRPIHRLDRATSGVLLLAKNLETARFYSGTFQERCEDKVYIAEVRGKVLSPQGILTGDLGKDEASQVSIRRCVVDKGETAITEFVLESHTDSSSLVRLHPKTGRRHQLRTHLHDLGHPIVNDPLYDLGDEYYLNLKNTNVMAAPMHLHAWKLSILLPNKELKTFQTEPPTFWKIHQIQR